MRWFEYPFALTGLLMIAAVVPVWLYFLDQYAGQLELPMRFLAGFVLPAVLLLYLASWIEPRGT